MDYGLCKANLKKKEEERGKTRKIHKRDNANDVLN